MCYIFLMMLYMSPTLYIIYFYILYNSYILYIHYTLCYIFVLLHGLLFIFSNPAFCWFLGKPDISPVYSPLLLLLGLARDALELRPGVVLDRELQHGKCGQGRGDEPGKRYAEENVERSRFYRRRNALN